MVTDGFDWQWTLITSGLLQGSVLCLVIFIIYINDVDIGISLVIGIGIGIGIGNGNSIVNMLTTQKLVTRFSMTMTVKAFKRISLTYQLGLIDGRCPSM